MLAMAPVADRADVPLITVSGTAKLTELGYDVVFRFFPGDAVVKVAHARYAVEEIGMKRPAILYQTTAYGQSGHGHLVDNLARLGVEPVLEEALDPGLKDLAPALERARRGRRWAAAPASFRTDGAGSATGIFTGLDLPIVAGSALHQPTTADLLEPEQLKGVCAETAASPVADPRPEVQAFTEAFRAAFDAEPDAFALAQYDGLQMVLAAVASGAETATEVKDWLASKAYEGVAMTYRSDGTGNMAHDAVIICYDGASRTPSIKARYGDVDGVLGQAGLK